MVHSLNAFGCHFSKSCFSFLYRNLKLVSLTFLYPLPMPLQKWVTIGTGKAISKCLLNVNNNNNSSSQLSHLLSAYCVSGTVLSDLHVLFIESSFLRSRNCCSQIRKQRHFHHELVFSMGPTQ